MEHTKKPEIVIHSQGEKQATETVCESNQDLTKTLNCVCVYFQRSKGNHA